MVVIGDKTTPAQRLRIEWGQSLRSWMDGEYTGVTFTRRQLVEALTQIGYPVTEESVRLWLKGATAPRPHMQAAIAQVMRAPVGAIFPPPKAAA